MFLINMGVPGVQGARAGGLVCPTGQNRGSRLRGLISCLVFVLRLDHPYRVRQECMEMEILPYLGKVRHVLDREGGYLLYCWRFGSWGYQGHN